MHHILSLAAGLLLIGATACTNRQTSDDTTADTPAVVNNDSTTIIVSLDTTATSTVADTIAH